MLASGIYHLSSKSGGLEGVLFVAYREPLVWLDRVLAAISIARGLHLMYSQRVLPNVYLVLFALACLAISDGIYRNRTDSTLAYSITHAMWHVSAFTLFGSLFKATIKRT